MIRTGQENTSCRVLLNTRQILEAVDGGELLFHSISGTAEKGFSSVTTDSRKVSAGSLFVPLMGEFQDGHKYVAEAAAAGASVIFVDKSHVSSCGREFREISGNRGTVFVAVNNTLSALQQAAGFYVSLFPDLLKVAVTGSSGKTTAKEMLAAVFSRKFNTVKNEGNLNSETGLPLSVFNIRPEHQAGVFELGMNRRNEIAETARVLRPKLGLVTNIGSAHIGILGSRRAIAEEKKNIFSFFDDTCTGFVPSSDDFAYFLADIPSGKVLFYGYPGKPGITEAEDLGLEGFRIKYEGLDIFLHLPGRYNLQNAAGVVALASYAGFSPAEIKAGLESVRALPGRTEILDISDDRRRLTVIKDCYNANPDSMIHVLDFCAGLPRSGRLVFVLGSMLELGKESESAHRQAVEKAFSAGADAVFLFGEEMVSAWEKSAEENGRNKSGTAVFIPEDIGELSRKLSDFLKDGDTVLLKASRGMALERVLPALRGGENIQGVQDV